jgi:hypothetical protein
MLREVELEQYIPNFEEEEMTSMALLEVWGAPRQGNGIGSGSWGAIIQGRCRSLSFCLLAHAIQLSAP